LQWELFMQLKKITLGIGLAMATSLYANIAVASLDDDLAAVTEKKGYACLSCHKISETSSGPSYQQVADKYTSIEKDGAKLAERIIDGVGMPPKNHPRNWPESTMPIMTPNPVKGFEDGKVVPGGDMEAILKFIFELKKSK